MRKKIILFVTILLVITMVLTACVPPAPEEAAKEPVKEEPVEEKPAEEKPVEEEPAAEEPAEEEPAVTEPSGKLTWMVGGDILADFDPTAHQHLGMIWSEMNVYDRLIDVTVANELVPNLATEWSFIDDTTLELKLREGVKFHDDTDFNAEDVKLALERASSPDVVSSAWWPSGQVSVDIIDDYIVNVNTDNPTAALIFSIAMTPIPPAEYSQNPELFENNGQMGTGPFLFSEYDAGFETIHYTANMDYWNGPPKIKEFDWVAASDTTTMLAALQAGETDIITRPEIEQVPLIDDDPNLYTVKALAIEQMFLGFKTQKPPMDNVLVRQAMAYAVDTDTIVNDILDGQGGVADSHLSPTSWGYAVPDNRISYDPEKAKDLLAEAGYEDPADLGEIRLAIMLGFYPKAKEYGEYLVQNLQDIGINAIAMPEEVGVLYAELFDPNPPWNMWMTGFYPPSPEPDIVLNALFRSPGLLSNYESDSLDDTLAQEGQELDPEKRAQLLKDVTLPALMDELPEFPLFTSMFVLGVSNRVKGLEVGGTGAVYLLNVSVED